jgi:hypothetical protein
MKRREFIAAMGGAAAWPVVARGQQTDRVRRVGVLLGLTATDPEGKARIGAFLQALQQLGWTDGRNIQIIPRFTDGNADRARRALCSARSKRRTFSGCERHARGVNRNKKSIDAFFYFDCTCGSGRIDRQRSYCPVIPNGSPRTPRPPHLSAASSRPRAAS